MGKRDDYVDYSQVPDIEHVSYISVDYGLHKPVDPAALAASIKQRDRSCLEVLSDGLIALVWALLVMAGLGIAAVVAYFVLNYIGAWFIVEILIHR